MLLLKCSPLVFKQRQCKFRISQWIIQTVTDQFIVFNQAMIRVFRECQWRKIQGIDHRLIEQNQVRIDSLTNRQIVAQNVMTKYKLSRLDELVQIFQNGGNGKWRFSLKSLILKNCANSKDIAIIIRFQIQAAEFLLKGFPFH